MDSAAIAVTLEASRERSESRLACLLCTDTDTETLWYGQNETPPQPTRQQMRR
jgi:hypothetical protein